MQYPKNSYDVILNSALCRTFFDLENVGLVVLSYSPTATKLQKSKLGAKFYDSFKFIKKNHPQINGRDYTSLSSYRNQLQIQEIMKSID